MIVINGEWGQATPAGNTRTPLGPLVQFWLLNMWFCSGHIRGNADVGGPGLATKRGLI